MSKRIRLEVSFLAVIEDDEQDIPEEVQAESTTTIIVPVLDAKYMVFPKVLEGVTETVILELRGKYADHLARIAAAKKKAEEEKHFLWNQPTAEDATT